jgi:hypothetical protein
MSFPRRKALCVLRVLSGYILLAALFSVSAEAQMRPNSQWRELSTPHFNVVFEAGLDSIAQHAARRAEAHHARLTAEVTEAPHDKIDIIIGDNTDITNGAATPLPSNRIFLWVRPPSDDPGLGYHNDWMDLVIAHELTHIFHMDRTSKLGRALRFVFGRVPFTWPFFPVLGTPDWTLEGLATYRESVHTGTGRVQGTFHEMVLRASVLENRFDPIDRVSGETPIWPGGQRAYIHGSKFMEFVAQRAGERAHRDIIHKTATSIIPPTLAMDRIARNAVGKSFTRLYAEWRDSLARRYTAVADSLRANGVTATEHVAGGERQNYHPRISPDGRRLAFVQEDGRNSSSVMVLDLATRATERTRRNGLAQVSWLNNSTLATTQFDLTDPYTIRSDLYIQVDGNQQRVSYGARVDAVDADRAGTKYLLVKHARGTTSLVQRDAVTGRERVIVAPRTDVQWVSARWSPDGTRIAAERWRIGGDHDVEVMDTLGVSQFIISSPGSLNTAPTWTPDGRYVVFASDRTGISNIYARDANVNDPRVFEITNVLTGAFQPDVSPDGQFVYFAAYHATGFAIERTRLDPAVWRSVYAGSNSRNAAIIPEQTGAPIPTRNYSALRSALPHFWLPLVQHDSVNGTFFGGFSAGSDNVGRHEWGAALAANFDNGRTMGWASYTYAGLGNPVLTVEASREYDYFGKYGIREDNLSLVGTMRRSRWRSALAASAGIEGTVIRRDTLDTSDRLIGVIGGFSFSKTRNPAYAISPEDGARASLFLRRRFDIDPVFNDDTYSELQAVTAAYKSIDAFGFAHHVLAARLSGIARTHGGAVGPTDVGGTGDVLPVRGFDDGDRIGFRGWSASLEYRVPVALIGRGYRLWPVFVDRVAASAFIDAGNASCTTAQQALYAFCAEHNEMLLSTGAEVVSDVALLSFIPVWMRAGIAKPIQGPRDSVRLYFTLGRSF